MDSSKSFNLSNTSLGLISIFPSFSHSHDAAIDPNILALKIDLDTHKVKEEYAKRASPAPTASIIFFVKLGMANPFGLLFPEPKRPLVADEVAPGESTCRG